MKTFTWYALTYAEYLKALDLLAWSWTVGNDPTGLARAFALDATA